MGFRASRLFRDLLKVLEGLLIKNSKGTVVPNENTAMIQQNVKLKHFKYLPQFISLCYFGILLHSFSAYSFRRAEEN